MIIVLRLFGNLDGCLDDFMDDDQSAEPLPYPKSCLFKKHQESFWDSQSMFYTWSHDGTLIAHVHCWTFCLFFKMMISSLICFELLRCIQLQHIVQTVGGATSIKFIIKRASVKSCIDLRSESNQPKHRANPLLYMRAPHSQRKLNHSDTLHHIRMPSSNPPRWKNNTYVAREPGYAPLFVMIPTAKLARLVCRSQ